MKVLRGTPPPTVDREIAVDLTRDEVMAVLVKYAKEQIGPNLRLEELSVVGDEHGNLVSMTLGGNEIVPIIWNSTTSQATPSSTSATPPATPADKPVEKTEKPTDKDKEKVSNPAGLHPLPLTQTPPSK
jgi:hypothetical protein